MKIVKVNPGTKRSKVLAWRTGPIVEPFFRFNFENSKYEFVVELYDNQSGVKLQVVGSQIDWEEVIKGLQKAMKEAPAS